MLTQTPIGDRVLDLKLQPHFIVDVARTAFVLRKNASRIEAALDRGTIEASGRQMAVCEIEFELKEGAPTDVVDLARELIGDLPLVPSVRSKAERGFALASGAATDMPDKGLELSLDPQRPLREGIARITAACTRALIANAGLIDGPHRVEAVHQTRVATRRLRAALAIFRSKLRPEQTAHLGAELRWIAGLLGAARDCDVHQEEVFDPAVHEAGAPFGIDHLAADMRERQASAHRDLAEALRSARWRLLLLDLVAVPLTTDDPDLDQPFASYLVTRLRKRRKRLLRMAASLTELSPEERHSVRKKAKALRYAIAFLPPTAPGVRRGRYRRTLKALGALQDALGTLHDRDALHELLQSYAAGSHDRPNALGLFAAGTLAERQIDSRRLMKTAAAALNKVRETTPF